MSAEIKIIDAFGQFDDNGTGHPYTFSPIQQQIPVGWKNVMKDPRNEISPSLKFCYAIWSTQSDWWIAKLVKNPHDSRGGFAMLSICLGPNRPADGEKAVRVLDNFAQIFLIERNWDDSYAEKALMNNEQDLELVPCRPCKFVEPSIEINSAYRSFESRIELGKLISFLPQPGYSSYSRIFLVPKEMASNMPTKCLDEALPLKNIYIVQYPEDCMGSKTEVMDGDDLVVTYNKQGFEPVEKVIHVGSFSDFAFPDGTDLCVRSGNELRLVHNRVLEIKCIDKITGNEVGDFSVNNYLKIDSIIIKGKRIIVPENLTNTIELEIHDKGGKYEEGRVKLNLSDNVDNVVTVKLEPKAYNVRIKIEGESHETNLLMNPNNIRYRNGGFVCRIDDNKKTIQFVLQGKPSYDEGNEGRELNDYGYYRRHHHHGGFVENIPNWLKYGLYALGTLIVAYLIWLILGVLNVTSKPWPFGNKPTETEYSQPSEPQPIGDDQGGEGNINVDNETNQDDKPVVDSVAWNADVNYLENHKDYWNKAALKTAEFQTAYDALHNALVNGDVEGVIRSDSLFNGITENRKNGYYKDIIKRLKAIQKNGNQDIMSRTEDELKRISKKDETVIAIGELRGSVILLLQTDKKTQDNAQPAKQAPAQTQKGDADKKTNNGGRPDSND